MAQKLFVSDLDGTLLDDGKEIPQICVDMVKKVVQAGHLFVFATGRTWDDAERYYNLLGLSTPCILDNGARMIQPSNKYFVPNTHSMSNFVFYKLYNNEELMKEVDYFVIKTATGHYANKVPKDKEFKKNFNNMFHINLDKIKNVDKEVLIKTKDRHSDMLSIVLILQANANISNVIREIKAVTHGIEITKWSLTDNHISTNMKSRIIIELNNRSANKLSAVQSIQDYFDIADNNVYVFGDGENDVRMLNHYINSVAVSNASYSALINAHHVSRFGNNEGAVGKELESINTWDK